MSVLPVGRSLRQFLPDVDEFLRDPASYLGAAPVEIGPRRAYGFAALFGAFGAACLAACAVSGNWHDERLLLGIGLLLGASVWLGWSLRLRGHSLLLRPDGVEVRHRETTIWCPWALFNADGAPVVPEGDNPRVAVILPVSAEAIPFVELRRHESPVAHGAQIKEPYFRFTAPDQLVLAARYEVAASDLGVLLLQLGNRLGRQIPRGTPPPEAYPVGEAMAAEVSGPDSAGWYTVPVGRLHFPRRCCRCEQPTDATVAIPLGTGDIAGRLAGVAQRAEIAAPLCADCRSRVREMNQRAGVRGLNIGAILGMVTTTGLAVLQGERAPVSLAFAGLAGAAIGSLVGFLAGSATARPLPVQFRRYRPDLGIVQVRFDDPHYADLVLAGFGRKSAGQG
jgi:hypothetical protein